jgi:amino acid permease
MIVIPISYLRRLDSLKYTSIAALVSMAYLVILVARHNTQGDAHKSRNPKMAVHQEIICWLAADEALYIPISYLRRLDSLKYTSIAALVSMAYLVILVVYNLRRR